MVPNPFGLLQDFLSHSFYRYGLIVARHPNPFILGPILLTMLLSFGIFNLRISDDLRFLYSPEDSLSRFEYQIHQNFSGDSVNTSIVAVALESADGDPNMLRRRVADAVLDFERFVQKNLTLTLEGREFHFGEDICSKQVLCPLSNLPVKIFFGVLFNETSKQDAKLQWPVMKVFDNKFFLPTYLYGVQLDETQSEVVKVEMIHLVYHISAVDEFSSEQVSAAFEQSLRETLETRKKHINAAMFSLNILKDEMQKNTTYTFPFISLTVFLLMSFTVGSCMTGDWITSKPIEALMGIFCSSLAIMSSAGLLFALGIPYISQVTVMPFLAFAVGVDDTYVMLGAWQDTKRSLSPEKRMAMALEEAGSAISVTSLTSVLSFTIGAMSTTPAISIFCKFIATAVAFDWFYQVTLFAAVLALGGKREAAGYHCIMVWKKMSKEQIYQAKSQAFISPMRNLFENVIAPFMCRPFTRIFFFGVYMCYICFAFYGCSLLKPNLTPSRLLVDDSPLTYYLKMAENRIWSECVVGRVYVNNAPDFSSHPELMEPMLQLVTDLESTKYSMGSNSTSLWLRDFNNYRQYFAEDDEHFYETFKSFLGISIKKQWNSFIKWAPNPDKKGRNYVNKFYFTTAFKIPDWNARTSLLLEWRNITKSYPQFQALVFDENNFFSDQMLELKSTTLSSLGTAILAMIVICVLFIADSTIVFYITFILVSMDIGVAGYLSLWGSDLEPTTVVNILMSIGQCIDFATHVGYRIYRSPYKEPNKRIADSLGAIGWPVVQAGVSTLLAIIVMILVPSNVVRMFARTSILVVATGLFHGIIILPIIIRSFASDIKVAALTTPNSKGIKTS